MRKGNQPFTEFAPVTIIDHTQKTPFIASFPHSGMQIPQSMIPLYTPDHLSRLRNTDWFLPELYCGIGDLGFSRVQANFSRYVIDVNRALKPEMVGDFRNHPVYATDTWGDQILKDPDCDMRIDDRMPYYKAYHDGLTDLMMKAIKRFGCAYVIDMHSFAVESDKDICLGAGRGQDTATTLFPSACCHFPSQGFSVQTSGIFSGGYITQYYGAADNVEVLQIELNYRCYLADGAENGRHIPRMEPQRFFETRLKLIKALQECRNACFDYSPIQKPVARRRKLTL
jgi:N-formylglutamate amidohydrolase